MTRAQRYAKKLGDARSRRPFLKFGTTTLRATEVGNISAWQSGAEVFIDARDAKRVVKWLQENFVRRDK